MHRPTCALVLSAVAVIAGGAFAETEPVELHMIHSMRESLTRGSDSIGVFTPDGPKLATLLPSPRRVDYVTFDPRTGTYWGQKTSAIGTIDASGSFSEVALPESVDLSHSGGLAFDAARGCILVASKSGAGTVVWEHAPDEGTWNEIGNLGREQLHGLACDGDEGLIYVLEKSRESEGCARLHVHNRNGARILSQPLSTPVPFYSALHTTVQLAFRDGAVYALTSHYAHPRAVNSLYRIDPASGQVSREPYNTSRNVWSKTWPGWKGGPPPSRPMAACGAEGSGDYSGYRTPEAIVSSEPSELHVIAIGSGAVNYLEWLKKVDSLKVSAGDGSVSVEVGLDLDAETRHPVVEVGVGASAKPVTLALLSRMPVVWSIDAAPDATIAKVVTFGAPHFSKSRVLGVDDDIVADGGDARAACAWELERSSAAVEFDEMIAFVRSATGLRETSYQGMSRAAAFGVPVDGNASVSSAEQ